MNKYDHKKIEKKWQQKWEESHAFRAEDDVAKKKEYILIEFPYPSGDGLHVGHIRSWTALDIVARKHRAEGKNVLYPIGWDAFGLPGENYAIKMGIHPTLTTKQNTDNFRRQIKALGISFDWSREINTTDPAYYKWTQWIFIQLFKKGLAYKTKTLINWCPKDKVTLANEEVIDGACERCGTPVEKREKEQWMLAITKYAQRLYDDLDTVNYIPAAKVGQRNWIGPSQGLIFTSPVKDTDISIQTFSAHYEAFYADTFIVIAPEHSLLPKLLEGVSNKEEILARAKEMLQKRAAAGREEIKEVEGIFTGRYTVDPVGNGELPIWIANFALADYGTGIVKCSAHDERDFAFAKKYGVKLKTVLYPADAELRKRVENLEVCFTDMQNGILSEPKEFEGKVAGENREKIADYGVQKGFARKTTTYKLRDWVFGRQRYWGEPIPMIHCEKCGWQSIPESELPILLPETDTFLPGIDGESPLANMHEWVNVVCPQCKGSAKRETDVMPQWAGSSWYYLRYTDPRNDQVFADQEKLRYWTPVDWYNGGMEHTTLHLLYSRFWHKFLFDIGQVPTSEPYLKRTSHGLILAEGGEKMSKSKGNTVSPDALVEQFGADSLRLYEMFIGPFDQPVAWNTDNIMGVRRFLERVWKLSQRIKESPDAPNRDIDLILNQSIKKIADDIENLKLNTAVSKLMILLNFIEKEKNVGSEQWNFFLKLLAPFAPHIACELAEQLGVTIDSWPEFDPTKAAISTATIALQINGKARATIEISVDMPEQEALEQARANPAIAEWLAKGKEIRAVYVPGRIINFVVDLIK